MNRQLNELAQHRIELLTRIAAQRVQMADAGEQWQTRLAMIDKGLNAVRFLRSSPVLLAGTAALLLFRRHGAIGLIKGAWQMWKRYRAFASYRRGRE